MTHVEPGELLKYKYSLLESALVVGIGDFAGQYTSNYACVLWCDIVIGRPNVFVGARHRASSSEEDTSLWRA